MEQKVTDVNIPQGYQLTEAGIIPKDWEVKTISQLCKLINGRGFKPYEWKDTGLPIIRIQNLNGSEDYNYFEGIYNPKILIENGQLLFAWSGSRGTSFGPHIWKGKTALLNYHTWKVIVNEKEVDHDFFLHALRHLTKHIEDTAHGASALVHTQKGEMEAFLMALPPTLKEQKKISVLLSDADNHIDNLQKLVSKKRRIKQGAMQELLQPKEGWVTKKIEEICSCLDNLRVPLNDNQRTSMIGDIPYCGANGIVGYVNDYVIDDKIILIAEDGGHFEEYLTRPIAYRMSGKCWVNNHAHILKAFEQYHQDFIFYSLVHKNILNFINGGTRAKLNKADLLNIEIKLPPTKVAQENIAVIIAEMDEEIEALELKLNKYKMLKQGMMQELLTGKTRLVNPNPQV